MEALPSGGGMAAIEAGEDEVVALLGGGVDVAAVNGPRAVVVSGSADVVEEVRGHFAGEGRRATSLRVSHAFHSVLMEPMLAEFAEVLSSVVFGEPEVPVVSSVTGTVVDMGSVEYWVRNVRETVRFHDAVTHAVGEWGLGCVLEVGPGAGLTSMVAAGVLDVLAVPLQRAEQAEDRAFLTALGEAFVHGIPVDWSSAFPAGLPWVDLPTYPFQGDRYWISARTTDPTRALTSSRTGAEEQSRPGEWRYRVTWEPVEIDVTGRLSGTWLVVAGSHQVRDESLTAWLPGLEAALTAAGATVRHETFDAEAPDTLGSLDGVTGVVSLLGLGASDAGLFGTLRLVQSLVGVGFAGRLWAVTAGGVGVGPADGAPVPELAQVWGLGRVAGLEHPGLWGGLIDLPSGQDFTETAGRQLVGVLSEGVEDQVALRQGVVLGRRLVHAAPAPVVSADRSWRPSGTVLITGGTGGLGAHVARWVVERGAEHVVLVSRRGADAPGAQELADDLAAEGCRVTIAACDVSDREAVVELLAGVPDEHPLDVVIHAAGVGQDGLLVDSGVGDVVGVGGAKVLGARWLDELTVGLELSAFVVFSSIAGVWGSSGQGVYGAANAYVDALVERRRAGGLVGTSVAWGPWAEAGMATVGDVEQQLRRRGLVAMPPADAIEALEQAVLGDEGLITVADVDWERFGSLFTSSRPSPLLTNIQPATDAPAADGARTGQQADAQRMAELVRSGGEPALLELVRRETAQVLGHSKPASVRVERSFKDLGFDSLAAVQLRNRLVDITGLELPSSMLFDFPSPARLTAELHKELLGDSGTGDVVSPPSSETRDSEPLAIVGLGCRLPGGVTSPEGLWSVLVEGRDVVSG
ncbi:SDR family NAD(P)-dependent oxidoreductase, partial [Streptomyces sp. NPDC047315]|uniref:type I polyketide synthase n=1 Tax=Streptomyces sp. NPDC047315 TaxID=3155142 RepID=UPI0033D56FC1